MAINQITTAQINGLLQSFGTQFNALVNQVTLFNSQINAIGTAGLQAAPFSYSSADATTIFNAAQDLANWAKVYQGLMYVTAGATVNTGVPTNNDGTHFGYPFSLNIGKCDGFGF